MNTICNCKVMPFGSKTSGFVLKTAHDEFDEYFVIAEGVRKKVKDHLDYEEKECIKLETSGGLEELIEFAKKELERRKGKNAEFLIDSSVLHEMCVRRKF